MFQEGADRDLPLDAESRYRVLWPHAMGGLGQIYVAEDQELHRRVALKEIRPEHAMDPVSRERFVVEAEVTGKMEHPGIVPVHGLGVHRDGRPFYAMRFIKGENLTTAIRQFHGGAANFTGREFRWLLRRFIDVCNTIAYAHSRGVLHRDLKPSNVMLGPFGETLVLDWGVAKAAGVGEPGAASAEFSVGDDPILRTRCGSSSGTAAGQAVGTPAYMSPEQAEGKLEAIGPASDVYNLGATLYVLLTNRRPFEGEPEDVIQAVREGRFRAPRRSTCACPGLWTPSAGGPWRFCHRGVIHRRLRWLRTSSAGWPTSRSLPGRNRRWSELAGGCAGISPWSPAGRPHSPWP